MTLRATEYMLLDWRPIGDDGAYFEWRFEHVSQTESTNCWAACLSNALDCFGQRVAAEEIVSDYASSKGGGAVSAGILNIESADHLRKVWRRYGFNRADYGDGPISFRDLRKELEEWGPVQAEFWTGTGGPKHVALICGVRVNEERQEILVSDPAKDLKEWMGFEDVRDHGLDASGERWGPWRRTYYHLAYRSGYLRRFHWKATSILKQLSEASGNPPALPRRGPESNLWFVEGAYGVQSPWTLMQELTAGVGGYRRYRLRGRRVLAEGLSGSYALWESIRVYEPATSPFAAAEPLWPDRVRQTRWHHQIYDADGPRYYVHTRHSEAHGGREEYWRTVWVGERWLARKVEHAIGCLDRDEGVRVSEDQQVVMIRFGVTRKSELGRVLTLYLTKSWVHWIVHVQGVPGLPAEGWVSSGALAEALADA